MKTLPLNVNFIRILKAAAVHTEAYSARLSGAPESTMPGLAGEIVREDIERSIQDAAVLYSIVERYEAGSK